MVKSDYHADLCCFIFYLYQDVIVVSCYTWSSYSMLEAFYVM